MAASVKLYCDECHREVWDDDEIYCYSCYKASELEPSPLHAQLQEWVDSEQLALTQIERIFLDNVIEAVRKSLPLSTVRGVS